MKKKIKGRNKHRGRRELLRDLQMLREANKALMASHKELENQHNVLKERFRRAGSELETLDASPQIPVVTAEIEPQAYGIYKDADAWVLTEKDAFKSLKRELLTRMVDGLMDGNIVQFIAKKNLDYPFYSDMYTFAAKMYVIPWEQMVRKRLTVRYRPLE